MTGALTALVSCVLVLAPLPEAVPSAPTVKIEVEVEAEPSPEEDTPGPAVEEPEEDASGPAVEESEEGAPDSVSAEPEVRPLSIVVQAPEPEPEPETQPTALDSSQADAPPSPPPEPDRIELRNGDQLEGELVEFVPKSHMTLRVRGTERRETYNWAQVEYVQRAGEPPEAVSAGKPTIAELAGKADRIRQQETIGLGFAYAAYSLASPSVSTWVGFALRRSNTLLNVSIGTTVTAGVLLAIGAGFYFSAQVQRKRLRKVILSAGPTSGGALAGVVGRF